MTIAQLSILGQAAHPEAPILLNRDWWLSVRRACGHYDQVAADGHGAQGYAARTDVECVTCQRAAERAWLDYIGDRADVYADMAEA